MSMKMLVLLLAMLLALIGCDGEVVSTSDVFLIPQEQMAVVVKDANDGDLKAIKRLIAHYDATSGSDAIAEEWKAKARSLGDPQELYYYAARLFTGARSEPDPVKKKEMLAGALDSARRSYANDANASTQQLIEEISEATNR